jgi:hypothetical protein
MNHLLQALVRIVLTLCVAFISSGPNNVKQYVETFTNNGQLNSMYILFNTPGGGNTVRIFNHNTVEFPLKAYVTAVKV